VRIASITRRAAASAAVAIALAGVIAGCGSAKVNPASMPDYGDSATWAEIPGFTPNFIFPLTSPADYGTWNMNDFQDLLYRPLYWFGNGESPTINYGLSLAGPPHWAADDKSFTITLKPYKWSDGETVTATDVLFWMNLLEAEKDQFGGYVPGYFPDNVTSVTALNASTVRFTLKSAYNRDWFLYNELSQITPLPSAWDKTGPSAKSDCAANLKDCAGVYSYLSAQNSDLSGYASSPVWSVVDGPWKLSAFNPDGALTMVPNPSYSGPVKPKLDEFREVPFTSQSAEYDALQSGTSAVQVGYVPIEDIPHPTASPQQAGPNPLAPSYTLTPWVLYGVDYFPMKFSNPSVGPIFKQLYFRQALQYTVDQNAMIKGVFHGYGYPTTNGVPTLPRSSLLSPAVTKDPFPFSIAKAKALLSANGWNVTHDPGTCVRPGTGRGECGQGIRRGEALSFNLKYATGSAFLVSEFLGLQSDAGLAGIQLNLAQQAGQEITATDTACTPSKATPCTWQMGDWGTGWVFAPDYYPSGEDLFLTGSVANYGSYSDPKNDQLIKATLAPDATTQSMYAWEQYIAKQVPVVWMPDYPIEVLEVVANLHGVTPLNTFDYITPENWYYAK
jgi:peptide/nickel transport system substrate-binding protein